MDVIEQFRTSKTGRTDDCEDRLVVTDDYAAVIDGATSKTALKLEGQTMGQLAARIVASAIPQLPPEASLSEVTDRITGRLHAFYERNQLTEQMADHPAYRAIASAAIYSRARGVIWMIGDCQCRVGRKNYEYEKQIDRTLAYVRSLVLRLERLEGATDEVLRSQDPGREFILPLLRRQSLLQNVTGDPFGFAVFDGFPVAMSKVRRATVPEEVTEIVLATDGYPEIAGTLEETEAALERALESDPLCIGPLMGTKGLTPDQVSYDDRTYLRLSLD